jgi:hypothetical protein
MSRLILCTAIMGLAWNAAQSAPTLPSPKGPSPEAIQQVEKRHEGLRKLELLSRENRTPEQLAELDAKLEPAFQELAAAIDSKDPHVSSEAIRDLTNNDYRAFAPEKLVSLLLPLVKKAETDPERINRQGWVLGLLRWKNAQPFAKEAKADVLKMVVDDKVNTYLRGQAIVTLAAIAPGDPEVIRAFIAVLENPNPKNSSGVHDRVAEQLGEMGRAAATAKKAILGIFERGEFYQDSGYIALGQIERDEKPKELQEYLKRLRTIDKVPIEQAAAAFLHVVELARTGKKHFVGKPAHEEEIMDAEVVRATMPVLLTIIEDRPADVHTRAALRALRDLGPGSSPAMAKRLIDLLLKDRATLEKLRSELAGLDAGPKRDAKIREINRVYYADHGSLLDQIIDKLGTTDPEAAVPIANMFATFIEAKEQWPLTQRLAKKLAQFGKGAKPAVPAAIKALREAHISRERDVYLGVFTDYLLVLVAAGGDEPGVRPIILEFLDPKSNVMQKSGANAPTYQVRLFVTLAAVGLPADGPARKEALTRIKEGLNNDMAEIFSAACVVVASEKKFTKEEAAPLVQAMVRVLDRKFSFRVLTSEETGHLAWIFHHEHSRLIGKGMALRALGSLGPLASDALPAIKRVASQELIKHSSDFLPEPTQNVIIREAGLAQKRIESTY